MKKIWLPLSIALLLVLLLREFYSTEPVPEPVEAPRAKTVNRQTKVAPAPPAPPPPVKNPAPAIGKPMQAEKSADGGRPKPPKGTVPFELHDGLVVSYGDVLLGRPTIEDFPESGFIEAPKLNYWKGNEVAFSIDPNLPNPERVQRVLAYFNEMTPVRFVPYTNQTDSIVFSPGSVQLCLSYVGKIGGHQPIYLDDRCSDREITHEIMHALGFVHEHSRPDRDRYVRVNWDAIEEDKQSQFEIVPPSLSEPHKGRPFDFQSIMIYDSTAFARRPGDTTIQPLSGQAIEPSREGLSAEDLTRLQILYGGR